MLRSVAIAALLGAGSAAAASTCSLTNKCPEDAPCCSQYGECGVGAYCLGGCDPRMSFSLDSCTPAPVCKSKTMTFDKDLSSIADISDYLGDPSTADWMAQGEPAYFDGNVLLTMPKNSVGTVLATTEYMWYGNVKAKFKTSRGKGVVTAFILLSDVKDEIDYEFVGVDLGTAQTNWYFQGIPDYNNSGNITKLSDTFNNYHTYEINWTPDQIQWLVDGQVGRTVNRKDHWNATSNQWSFPQTPSRVQISIWPGGLASNAQGTIDWAGGEIDWNAQDIQKNGYFYATFESVTVSCYKATGDLGSNSGVSYTYDNIRATNDTVVNGNKRTNLATLQGTGLDMDAGKQDDSSSSSSAAPSGTASKSASKPPKNTQASIPGGSNGSSGTVPGGDSGDKGSSGGSSGDSSGGGSGGSSGGSDGGSGGSAPADTSGCSTSSFNQDCGDSSDSSGSKSGNKNAGSKTGVSALAMGLAGAALCLI
ncbi:CAZyme family GH16 [Trichoderma aggressivum f. europaeum]|uniref:Crh-like protein n=1 Tax=Trichoderma aggressivum f. europaeum TaxID=173218 RepID=A0AAE1II15_9HYPO|nr:CAZyme family GH16 [Trichoderma aggressivum f. europaeum]